jgi:hypothetical protein
MTNISIYGLISAYRGSWSSSTLRQPSNSRSHRLVDYICNQNGYTRSQLRCICNQRSSRQDRSFRTKTHDSVCQSAGSRRLLRFVTLCVSKSSFLFHDHGISGDKRRYSFRSLVLNPQSYRILSSTIMQLVSKFSVDKLPRKRQAGKHTLVLMYQAEIAGY